MSQSSFTRYSFGADLHGSTGIDDGRNILIYISRTDGTPFTGLTHASSGLAIRALKPVHDGSAVIATITPVAGTLDTYTSGGLIEVSASFMPGVYQFGVPKIYLEGAQESVIVFSGVSLMSPCRILIDTQVATEILDANADDYSLQIFGAKSALALAQVTATQTGGPAIASAVLNATASSYANAGSIGAAIGNGGGGGGSFYSQPLFRQTLYKGINAQSVFIRVMDKNTGNPATGLAGTLSAQIRKINIGGALTGAVNLVTNSAVEVGQGVYVFTVSDTECNSDAFVLLPASSNSNVLPYPALVETVASNPSVDVVSIGGDAAKVTNIGNFFSSTGYNAANSTIGHAAVVDSVSNISASILGASLALRGVRGRATNVGEAIAHIEQILAGPNRQNANGRTTFRNDGSTVLHAQTFSRSGADLNIGNAS